MKKYLLGLLAIPFGLIAFSSAVLITCENGNCTNSFTAGSSICDMENGGNIIAEFNGSVSCGGGNTSCSIAYQGENSEMYYILFANGEIDNLGSWCEMSDDETVNFTLMSNDNIESLNGLTLGTINPGGDDNTGGGIGGGVISDGFGSLTPVITGVKDTIIQLIPLVVYIGIGVLLAIIGFYAIRWLVNWMGGKFNSYFRSKRN